MTFKSDEKWKLYIVSKYLCAKYCSVTKDTVGTSEWRSLAEAKWSNWTSSVMDQTEVTPHLVGGRENTAHICKTPAKLHNLNLFMKKHETDPCWETFYKIAGLWSSKNIKVLKVKEVLGKCSRLQLSKETWQLSATQGMRLALCFKVAVGTKVVKLNMWPEG